MMPVPNGRTRLLLELAVYALLSVIDGDYSYAAAAPDEAVLASGEHIARLQCSACHVVASDQEFPPLLRTPTPSFSEIANRPATSSKSLQRFITTTHWDMKTMPVSMPYQMLTPEQVVAVSRYILSLRKS